MKTVAHQRLDELANVSPGRGCEHETPGLDQTDALDFVEFVTDVEFDGRKPLSEKREQRLPAGPEHLELRALIRGARRTAGRIGERIELLFLAILIEIFVLRCPRDPAQQDGAILG